MRAPQTSSPPRHGNHSEAWPAGSAGGKKKGGEPKAPSAAPAAEDSIDQVDIRVGTIVKCDKHPEADSLYLEEIDLGEPTGPRQVCMPGVLRYWDRCLGNTALFVFARPCRSSLGWSSLSRWTR